jgi:hypothetical protein
LDTLIDAAIAKLPKRLQHQGGTDDRKLFLKCLCIMVWHDFKDRLDQNSASVKRSLHAHRGNTGMRIARCERPMDGSCASPPWEQTRVEVDAAVVCGIEDLG